MYGDSHGSPGQDDHFDPSSRYEPGPFESGIPDTDVKVAGPHDGTWSRHELGEMDPYQPEPSSRNSMLIKGGVAATAALVVLGGAVALGMTSGGGSGKTATAATTPKAQPQNPGVDAATLQQNADDNAKKIVMDRASKAASSDARKAPPLSAKGAPPSPTASPSSSSLSGGVSDPMPSGAAQLYAKSLMGGYGWSSGGQFGCLVNLWNRESGWNYAAANPSGAYGIPQALPGSRMASVGPDWRTNAKTQIKWGLGYIQSTYNTPCGAWAHSNATGWY